MTIAEEIIEERRRGELLGPLLDRYGAEAVVKALGVLPIARDLGVFELGEDTSPHWEDEL